MFSYGANKRASPSLNLHCPVLPLLFAFEDTINMSMGIGKNRGPQTACREADLNQPTILLVILAAALELSRGEVDRVKRNVGYMGRSESVAARESSC